jgi:hypothetical protein
MEELKNGVTTANEEVFAKPKLVICAELLTTPPKYLLADTVPTVNVFVEELYLILLFPAIVAEFTATAFENNKYDSKSCVSEYSNIVLALSDTTLYEDDSINEPLTNAADFNDAVYVINPLDIPTKEAVVVLTELLNVLNEDVVTNEDVSTFPADAV